MIVKFEEDCVYLNKLPVPPSVNDYVNRRYPTKKKKEFLREWSRCVKQTTRQERLQILKFLFEDVKKKNLFIKRKALATVKVEYMWATRLTTKDGKKMKIFDSSNRLKLIEDCLAKFIGIDDCYFKEFNWTTVDYKEEGFCARVYKPVFFG